ncbi:hypothetical protein HYDPIDRAFT_73991, partial [Hydnomerulius pinastri MD-312]
YLAIQLAIAFDVYLDILNRIDQQLKKALNQHTPNWRLLNDCPACFYKLQDEPPLEFEWLVSMDSNNSLKVKYPLAIVDNLLSVYGPNGDCIYNIGCTFVTTLRASSLGLKAAELNLHMMVGSFHGHTHNWRCQLDWHPLYIMGADRTDGEG